MSIHIEGNKILIEVETTSPEEFYQSLLREMINCIQLMSEAEVDDVYFLLELYKALLPDQEQTDKMFGKKTT